MSSGTVATIVLVLAPLVIGGFIGFMSFNLTVGAKLIQENTELFDGVSKLERSVARQRREIDNLTFSTSGQQNRRILESLGWRPLAAESQPKDGELILVSGAEAANLRAAPNGSHYARFKKLSNGEAQLGPSLRSRVELNGMVLWMPQRVLVR